MADLVGRVDLVDAGDMFDRLSANQARVERWAEAVNDACSTWNGLTGVLFTAMTFMGLSLAALRRDNDAMGTAFIILLAVACFLAVVQLLYGVTMANRTFVRQKIRLLNDAKLVPIISRTFTHPQVTFEHWLDTHEASAARVFGIRITTKRCAEAIGVLGSVVAILATVIVQKHVGM